ncbi:L-lysine 6-monooxygenase (NADPH-requiring)-domain-containing protein [Elsinoe ampelina]|uniref:L-ornithine N(5)-monooxygenase [NAD(P)H] n=1 Tax=Elsinoe ampelina TaxID=302913 RepID=A0A6A6G5B7_9PEZI|nr:L-lysine 6-monooxygenase (NADPH-requiring)-domain-containing protein [Elsinoe ampelina]
MSENESAMHGQVFDLVVLGLDPSSLAVAAQLVDQRPGLRVKILNENDSFEWRPANALSESRLQTTFMRDLTTTSNPRSSFTFLNYLHRKGRLVNFINVSKINPMVLEMRDYLSWVVEEIEKLGWIEHGKRILRVEPLHAPTAHGVEMFSIRYKDIHDGNQSTILTKKLVLVNGKAAELPAPFRSPALRHLVSDTSSHRGFDSSPIFATGHIAIVGCSQEAAEIYKELQSKQTHLQVTWFIQEQHLRPKEVTAFTQLSIDDPSPEMANYPPELRQQLSYDTSSASRISPALLDWLYESEYLRPLEDTSYADRQHGIKTSIQVVGAELDKRSTGDKVWLLLKDSNDGIVKRSEGTFDHIIAVPQAHSNITSQTTSGLVYLTEKGRLDVDRDYGINFARRSLQKDCGVWLLGSLPQMVSSTA